jgi:3-oxoacid CoA-transferase subunit B
VVDRIISDLAVFDLVRNEQESGDGGRRLTLTRLAPGVTVEEIRDKTEASFSISLEAAPVQEESLEGATA